MDPTSPSNRLRRWLWIAAIWTGVGLIDATQNVFAMRAQGMHHSWVHLFISLTLSFMPWMVATPLVIQLGRRYRPSGLNPTPWLVHLGAVAILAVIAAAWVAWLEVLLQPWAPDSISGPFLHAWPRKFYNYLFSSLILYAFILTISVVLDSKERLATQKTETARLNEQLSNARLAGLRQQIEPHFIFNALNSVVGLIRENKKDAAVKTVVALSDFLRGVMSDFNDPQVRLAQEVEFLEKYLEIQKARFSGRLSLSLQVPDELRQAQVPSLILQPLVENAIKHGIAKRVQGGAVRIAATSCEGRLRLSVYNDGPLLDSQAAPASGGIGLSNLRTRLKLLYGTDFELGLENHNATGVQASVSFPHREGA